MKEPKQRKVAFLVVRVTQDEKDSLIAKATEAGVKLSAFLRSLLNK